MILLSLPALSCRSKDEKELSARDDSPLYNPSADTGLGEARAASGSGTEPATGVPFLPPSLRKDNSEALRDFRIFRGNNVGVDCESS